MPVELGKLALSDAISFNELHHTIYLLKLMQFSGITLFSCLDWLSLCLAVLAVQQMLCCMDRAVITLGLILTWLER